MSQREHVAQHASSQAPVSPPTPTNTKPAIFHRGSHASRSQELYDETVDRPRVVSSGSDTSHPAQARHFSVHTILNPSGTQPDNEAGPRAFDRHEEDDARQTHDLNRSRLSQSPPQAAGFPMSRVQGPQPNYQMAGRSASIGTVSDRSSPGSTHPSLALDAPRRLLTPRSPRSLSATHPPPHIRPLGQALGQLPGPSQASDNRSAHGDMSSTGRFEHMSRFGPQAIVPLGSMSARPSPAGNYATPVRPQSQPMIPPLNTTQMDASRHSVGHGPSSLPSAPTPPPFGGPSFPSYSPSVEQGWATNTASPGPSRAARVATGGHGDNQLSFAITPLGGERMVIPVETYSGSKQADEKRQRNAGASARFRKRKKTKEEANIQAIQRLEKDNRDLERQFHDARNDADRLRHERDRLRELVYQTREISHLAYQMPQSPASSRTAVQLTGRNSMALAAPPSPSANAPYGSADPLTGERASRRRRTEPPSESPHHSYSMPQPMLPAITSPSYHGSHAGSHPGTPIGGTRPPSLPPLSGLTPPPQPGPTPYDVGAVPPANSNMLPTTYRREAYETGWAVGSSTAPPSGPRGQPDNRR